ncbi:MAG: hypothetical protein HQ510_02910 [Candidatus Marinimicrobia bacterium]|nr:hypothetical protein [Candidatus Neomarinimicrobiota bacterium]
MITLKKQNLTAIIGMFIFVTILNAGGISVDAGLTPAENRWIVRYQARQMERTGAMDASMTTTMDVFNLAYGIRPHLTLMVMQGWANRKSDMMGQISEFTGRNDMMLMAKYRLLRVNTRKTTLGIAATIKLLIPTGEDPFTSDYWSVSPGIFLSPRWNKWALDASTEFRLNDLFNNRDDVLQRGWETSVNCAIARQIVLGNNSAFAIAPVLEMTGSITQPDASATEFADSRESVIFLSPGMKLTYQSLILEVLWQHPLWQDIPGSAMEYSSKGLVGIRYML